MDKEKIKEILEKNINLSGLINDAIDGIAEPALREAVKKSSNKIDDIVLAALYQPLEDELKKLVADNLNWEKLIG